MQIESFPEYDAFDYVDQYRFWSEHDGRTLGLLGYGTLTFRNIDMWFVGKGPLNWILA